jgi:hypothetical protein
MALINARLDTQSADDGGAPSSKVVGWSDSDYASDIGEHRSRTEYVFMLDGAGVSLMSKLRGQ